MLYGRALVAKRYAKCSRAEASTLAQLYTGPMFYLYNAVLRGFPQARVKLMEGNTYTNTIYCIVSGIIKLSSVRLGWSVCLAVVGADCDGT